MTYSYQIRLGFLLILDQPRYFPVSTDVYGNMAN